MSTNNRLLPAALCAAWALLGHGLAAAQDRLEIYLGRQEPPHQPLSLLDAEIEDFGIPGSKLGLKDNQTTGKFLNHSYRLEQVTVGEDEDLAARFRELLAAGKKLFVADLKAPDLETIAGIGQQVLIFNIRSKDDALRNEKCHTNLLHLAPSRAMLADALMQYLSWKRWKRLTLPGKPGVITARLFW